MWSIGALEKKTKKVEELSLGIECQRMCWDVVAIGGWMGGLRNVEDPKC